MKLNKMLIVLFIFFGTIIGGMTTVMGQEDSFNDSKICSENNDNEIISEIIIDDETKNIDTSENNDDNISVENWQFLDGKWYYIDSNGKYHTGWLPLENTWYYMNSDGVRQTGWILLGNIWYYLNTNGEMLIGLQGIGNGLFYFDNSGAMQTGWRYINEKWYYFNGSGFAVSGWLLYGNKWYYMDSNYEMLTGLQTIGNGLFYFNNSGAMQTGWQYINEKWYYFNASGYGVKGWLLLGSTWYYMDSNYHMQTGWLILGNTWYYLNSSGAMHTGWIAYNGQWYFMDLSGAMLHGVYHEAYYLNADGTMANDSILNSMSAKAINYSSSTNYLILVDTTNCRVSIYSGRLGVWGNIHYFKCAPGKASTPTVKGEFTVSAKGYYFDSGSSRCYWYTQFYGNYLFHSTLYNKDGTIQDNRTGIPLSHGCVRLEIQYAKWIYDNIPKGTKVVVY